MLFLALMLVVASFVIYSQIPTLLIYWRHPWPVYALLLASLAVAGLSPRRGWRRTVTLGFCTTVTLLFVLYATFFSRLDAPALAIRPGDHLPDFTLRTSTNETFSPTTLHGKRAALYVFYRGDW
jgi:hypothetical protein